MSVTPSPDDPDLLSRLVASPILYRGAPVLTLPLIDQIHGKAEGSAASRLNDHKIEFAEGRDFFKVPYREWKPALAGATFGVAPDGPGGNRGPMILVTESGYAMLVKVFDDPVAWDVQRQLVKGYFVGRALVKASVDGGAATQAAVVAAVEAMAEKWIAPVMRAIEVQSAAVHEIKAEVGAVKSEVGAVKADVGAMRSEVDEIRNRVESQQRRVPLSAATERRHLGVIKDYFNGNCPACGKRRVLDDNGRKAKGAEWEHWVGKSDARVESTWLTCEPCNRSFYRDPSERSRRQTFFIAYQQRRREREKSGGDQLRIFGGAA